MRKLDGVFVPWIPSGLLLPSSGFFDRFVALIFFQNHQQDKIDDEAGV